MKCPVCKSTLGERELEGVALHFCPTCGGILYTKAAFRQQSAILRESPLEELPTTELFDRTPIPGRFIPHEERACPRCGKTMGTFNYAYDSNIILDRCSRCDLIWGDKGEIVKVAQYVKSNPKIDSLAEALADREADRAKYRTMAERGREIGAGGLTTLPFWIGLLPISDEEETRTIPIMTLLLILANIAIFFILPQSMETFQSLGFIADLFFSGEELYRIVTHQFLHVGFLHLAGNMLFLWIFGDNVEDRLGKIAFPLTYLFFGSAAAVAHAVMTSRTAIPCVGASGAISGLMGAYFIFFPQSRVRTVVGHWIVPIPAFLFLAVWFLLQLLFSTVESSIAYFAHMGGFLAGMVVAVGYKVLRKGGR